MTNCMDSYKGPAKTARGPGTATRTKWQMYVVNSRRAGVVRGTSMCTWVPRRKVLSRPGQGTALQQGLA